LDVKHTLETRESGIAYRPVTDIYG